ncbi:MAG: tocopherol cyclase family protein [Crocinitomicaceae bacterium]|nr:tocopherol cyclase family protein [Crocinitomicaceae bacterium]MDG1658577.1 tocopherol cyclase family protein [Crocinitomicaceae bacterium]
MSKTLALPFLIIFFSIGIKPAIAQDSINEVNFSKHERVPGYRKKKRKNPQVFQGNKKKENYFEGWYFKMVSNDQNSILSIIPGISLSENGEEQHAFIQVINGTTAESSYFSFPIEEFYFSKDKFSIRIGDNYFSEDYIVLNLENSSTSIKGKVKMSNQVRLLKKNKREAIMGWYRFVPFMQCYHGLVSLNHNLTGTMTMNDTLHNFDQGIGYIEKDWGKSMPSAWVWIQSNSFDSENTSFMLSIANIPWLSGSFTGFLGFFLHEDSIHRFATYTKAKLELEPADSDTIRISIIEKELTYNLEVYRSQSGVLKAPVKGSMDRRISESIDANLHLTILDENAKTIFEETSSITGLETVGDLQILSGKKRRKKRGKEN